MMNKKELVDKLIEVAKENQLDDNVAITESSDLIADIGFDSMDIVSLGIEIEDLYGVNLSPEDFSSIQVTPTAVAELILEKMEVAESL